MGRLNSLRHVNEHFSNQVFIFELQGYVHGKKIASKPLHLDFSGSDVLNGVAERVQTLQKLHSEVGWNIDSKLHSRDFLFTEIKTKSLHGEPRIAIEFHSPKM